MLLYLPKSLSTKALSTLLQSKILQQKRIHLLSILVSCMKKRYLVMLWYSLIRLGALLYDSILHALIALILHSALILGRVWIQQSMFNFFKCIMCLSIIRSQCHWLIFVFPIAFCIFYV